MKTFRRNLCEWNFIYRLIIDLIILISSFFSFFLFRLLILSNDAAYFRKINNLLNIYFKIRKFILLVFANGPRDQGSVPGRVIPKTEKWYLILLCLTLIIIRYVSKVKWSNTGKGVEPSLAPQCGSYWKESLRIALDNGCQPYL